MFFLLLIGVVYSSFVDLIFLQLTMLPVDDVEGYC